MNETNRWPGHHSAALGESLGAITDIAQERVRHDDPAVGRAGRECAATVERSCERIVHAVRDAAPAVVATHPADAEAGVELEEIAWEADLCADLARTLLLGGAAPSDLVAQLTVFGIDVNREYMTFRARQRPGHDGHRLAHELGQQGTCRLPDGLAVRIGGDLAGFFVAPPARVRSGLVGVGPPRTPDRLTESFHLASRALDAVDAFGLCGVHRFDTLGLRPAIVADADVTECLERRYLRPLSGTDSVPELLGTLRMYFDCGMHVARTAKRMFLHPNTLRYRISRFEELTGASLRDPLVAMEVWWMLQSAGWPGRAARVAAAVPVPCREPAPIPFADRRPDRDGARRPVPAVA